MTYLFQDIFVSVGKIYFVAVPLDPFIHDEEVLAHGITYLLENKVGNCLSPSGAHMTVSQVIFAKRYTESNIVVELSHPCLVMALRAHKHVNITVGVGKLHADLNKTFTLYDDVPDWMREFSSGKIGMFTLFKTDSARSVDNWINYNKKLGVDFFVLYLHGTFARFPKIFRLAENYRRRNVPVVFAEWAHGKYDTFSPVLNLLIHNVQVTAMNSALYRLKRWADWLGYFDLDEYIYLSPNVDKLRVKLDKSYKNVVVAIFSSSNSYVNRLGEHLNSSESFDLLDLQNYPVVHEANLNYLSRTKFFCIPNSTVVVGVHNPHLLVPEGRVESFDDFFFHFCLGNEYKADRKIETPIELLLNRTLV